ncbi:hypothetical protein BGZ47_004345 [Haplosporangium gracile]|nr:hypothetical protein BGZ47_004345 [Haplosporangium gracile]
MASLTPSSSTTTRLSSRRLSSARAVSKFPGSLLSVPSAPLSPPAVDTKQAPAISSLRSSTPQTSSPAPSSFAAAGSNDTSADGGDEKRVKVCETAEIMIAAARAGATTIAIKNRQERRRPTQDREDSMSDNTPHVDVGESKNVNKCTSTIF